MEAITQVASNFDSSMKEMANEEIYNETTKRGIHPDISEVKEALRLISDLKRVEDYFLLKVKENKA